MDEKRAVVLRVLDGGGTIVQAVDALLDYMVEKDARVSWSWCREFVERVKEIRNETE